MTKCVVSVLLISHFSHRVHCTIHTAPLFYSSPLVRQKQDQREMQCRKLGKVLYYQKQKEKGSESATF